MKAVTVNSSMLVSLAGAMEMLPYHAVELLEIEKTEPGWFRVKIRTEAGSERETHIDVDSAHFPWWGFRQWLYDVLHELEPEAMGRTG